MKPKAFIVEDDFAQRFGLKIALQDAGYEVTEADSGQKAWEIIKNAPEFDLAILDYHLGDITGISIAEEIKKQNKAKKIVIASSHLDEFIGKVDSDIQVFSKPIRETDVQKITAIGYDKKHIRTLKNKIANSNNDTVKVNAINDFKNLTALETLIEEIKKNNKDLILFDKSKINNDFMIELVSKQREMAKDIDHLQSEIRKLEESKLSERLIKIEEKERLLDKQKERKIQMYQVVVAILGLILSFVLGSSIIN